MINKIVLNDGNEMPLLGYGVFQVSPEECERCVTDALEIGYRSIDTAQAYFNEAAVGEAVSKSGIKRKDLFITTKVWVSNSGEEKAARSIDESLEKLKTDYIDLLLIHQPFGDYYGTYRAMEKAQKEGKVKSIGVSNFYHDRFVDLAEHVEVKPAVNQLETNVFFQQKRMREIMEPFGTKLMAWAPLAEGVNDFFRNPLLAEAGIKFGKSVAQVALRFLTQEDIIVIPKTVRKERMEENFNIFDFTLSEGDMAAIRSIDTEKNVIVDFSDREKMLSLWETLKGFNKYFD